MDIKDVIYMAQLKNKLLFSYKYINIFIRTRKNAYCD